MKFMLYTGATIGSLIGGAIGSRWGGALGFWSLFLGFIGLIPGFYVGYKVGQLIGE